MALREVAIILIIALGVPALLLIRLVPIAKASETDAKGLSRAFGRSQAWFYGGFVVLAVAVLLLMFC